MTLASREIESSRDIRLLGFSSVRRPPRRCSAMCVEAISPTTVESAKVTPLRSSTTSSRPPVFEDGATLAYRVPAAVAPPMPVVWLDRGWHVLERARRGPSPAVSTHWRWIGEEAGLRLFVDADGMVRLRLRARAFALPRRLAVLMDGVTTRTLRIQAAPTDFEVRFQVAAGEHEIALRSLDGAAVAGDGDRRRLSVAFFDIAIDRPTNGKLP